MICTDFALVYNLIGVGFKWYKFQFCIHLTKVSLMNIVCCNYNEYNKPVYEPKCYHIPVLQSGKKGATLLEDKKLQKTNPLLNQKNSVLPDQQEWVALDTILYKFLYISISAVFWAGWKAMLHI